MNIWDILGIPPTQDTKAIRRAYGTRSKVCHPEEQPEEFAQLRRAYEQALKEASAKPTKAVDTPPEPENMPNARKESSGLDFDALFAQAQDDRMQQLIGNPAFREIIERLNDPKQRNNKAAWKEFVYSQTYLEAHIQPGFVPALAEYLLHQKKIPSDSLPRIFCVWLAIIAGIFHFEKQVYGDGITRYTETDTFEPEDAYDGALLTVMALLDAQVHAQYNQSEMKKEDYRLDRLCFMLFNDFLRQYHGLRESGRNKEWYNAGASFAHTIESSTLYRKARGEIGQMAAFMVRHMNLPEPVCRAFYDEFGLKHYETSAAKKELASLYEALLEKGIQSDTPAEPSVQRTPGETAYEEYGLSLQRELLEIWCTVLHNKPTQEPQQAMDKINVLLEKSHYREVFLAMPFLNWLYGIRMRQICYKGGVTVRWADNDIFWSFMDGMLPFYEGYLDRPGVSDLIESITERNGKGQKPKEERLAYYPFPKEEEVSERFAVLCQLDGIIRQHTGNFSYLDHLLLANFAMARTCIITNILSPIDPKFERYQLRHVREMPGYLLQYLMDEPIETYDSNWGFIRAGVNEMVRNTYFEPEDVEAVTDRPEIIFQNYRSFLATWYQFTSFDFSPEEPTVRSGMTGGFVLYPGSMILRLDDEVEHLSKLLNQEWQRIQEDIIFLSEPRTYTQLAERLHQYEALDIFASEGL